MSELAASRTPKKKRNILIACFLTILAVTVVVGFYFNSRTIESTDDAYVVGDKIVISSKISGTVEQITATNTEEVKQNQVLVRIDRSNLNIKQDRAEAQLTKMIRDIRSQYHLIEQLKEQIAASEYTMIKLRDDLQRRLGGDADGTVTSENLQHAKRALQIAEAQHRSLLEALRAREVVLPNENIGRNPDVRLALAQLQEIYLEEIYSTIEAPNHGFIAQRSVQAGEQIKAGQPLMAVVPLDNVWVEANFKETQLGDILPGQKVTLSSDIYGDKHIYRGVVAGIGAGTGSIFSALPAENATGNWIKVVQRVPVKIFISHDQLVEHPLPIGGSMSVEIDTSLREAASFDQKKFQLHDNISQIYLKQRQQAAEKAQHFLGRLIDGQSNERK